MDNYTKQTEKRQQRPPFAPMLEPIREPADSLNHDVAKRDTPTPMLTGSKEKNQKKVS